MSFQVPVTISETVSLDTRIVNVFDLSTFEQHSHFQALCNFFQAITPWPPEVRRCPYAYVVHVMLDILFEEVERACMSLNVCIAFQVKHN